MLEKYDQHKTMSYIIIKMWNIYSLVIDHKTYHWTKILLADKHHALLFAYFYALLIFQIKMLLHFCSTKIMFARLRMKVNDKIIRQVFTCGLMKIADYIKSQYFNPNFIMWVFFISILYLFFVTFCYVNWFIFEFLKICCLLNVKSKFA